MSAGLELEASMTDDIDYASALDRIAADSHRRRELLWLLAKLKDDDETSKDLESVEPGLALHMRELVSDFSARGERLETPRERRDAFERLYRERFEHHAAELTRGPVP